MTPRNALIVFAKRPVPGRVKTRLTALLTEEEAARLYAAFFGDALEQYEDVEADVRVYLAPEDKEDEEDEAPMHGGPSFVQRGEGLGERMLNALLETFAAGYQAVVIIGTDHPTLPTAFVDHAFEALERPLSVALGPSDDGGYYLIGMNDYFPTLFEGMSYSHDGVFEETLRRAAGTRASVVVLPPWYDVDTPDALRRLSAEIDDTVGAPRTRRAVTALRERYASLRPNADS